MYGKIKNDLAKELQATKDAGLFKDERVIMTEQGAEIKVKTGQTVLNFCANNYLGLSSHPDIIKAAHAALEEWGYGMSSVRFICGTQDIHKQLEAKVTEFLGTEDTILYAACFDANGGVFEPFLDADCAVISDALNHASIIDGVRLCKAKGVFSMDGDIAKLDEICDLCEKYDALVLVDDSHSTGFMGKHGKGTHEYRGVLGRIDLITTTFGKALGGASGGCTSGRKEMIEWLRQKSRPYLFSNTLAPVVAGASLKVFEILSETTELRDKLERNQRYFREKMTEAGFDIVPGDHAIVPIMFGKFENDAKLAQDFARDMLDEGIYVIGFSFPVVPRGQARIRVQLSAGHEMEHIDKAIEAFIKIGKKHNVILYQYFDFQGHHLMALFFLLAHGDIYQPQNL